MNTKDILRKTDMEMGNLDGDAGSKASEYAATLSGNSTNVSGGAREIARTGKVGNLENVRLKDQARERVRQKIWKQ